MYSQFERINCTSIENMNKAIAKEHEDAIQNVFENNDELNNCKTTMNINDSTDLIMKQFEVNGSCKDIPETENNMDSIDGCVGYACLPGNIYQETDTYNTFHNYLVLQDTEPLTACTENHQVYNNWTKRKLPEHPMERRDVRYVGTFGQNIPKLQFNTCTFKKEFHC